MLERPDLGGWFDQPIVEVVWAARSLPRPGHLAALCCCCQTRRIIPLPKAEENITYFVQLCSYSYPSLIYNKRHFTVHFPSYDQHSLAKNRPASDTLAARYPSRSVRSTLEKRETPTRKFERSRHSNDNAATARSTWPWSRQ